MNAPFRTFRLQPPHAPPSSGDAPYSGRAWPPTRLVSLSAVLRTSHSASSLVSRIRPNRVRVAGSVEPVRSTDCPFTSSCSPRCVATTQLLSVTDGKLRQGGTSTLRCALTPKRTSRGHRPRNLPPSDLGALKGQPKIVKGPAPQRMGTPLPGGEFPVGTRSVGVAHGEDGSGLRPA